MQNNEFLVFGGGLSASVVDQSTYAALPARVSGFQSGLAQSRQLNKVWRQSSIMTAVLAQFIADCSGRDALDDGTTETLLANLKTAVPAAVNAVGVNSAKKLNGVNGANLLFNGSAEFGNAGWTSNIFSAMASPNNDTYFANALALSGSPVDDASVQFPLSAGIPVTISSVVYTSGMSGGTAQFRIEGVSASGASLGTICASDTLAGGSGWTYLSATGITPAGCVRALVHRYVNGSPSGVAGSVGFGRMKVELGNQPSLYSQEADLAALGVGPNAAPIFVGAARQLGHAMQFGQAGSYRGIVAVSGDYTISSSEFGYLFQPPTGNAGGFTITLPSAVGNGGMCLAFYNSSPGNLTLNAGNFNTSYGSTRSIVLPPNSTAMLCCDGFSYNGIGGSAGIGSGVRPSNLGGVGQWTNIMTTGGGANCYFTLPSGGAWAYWCSNAGYSFSGIAAGGSNVAGPFTASASVGFCWRIA